MNEGDHQAGSRVSVYDEGVKGRWQYPQRFRITEVGDGALLEILEPLLELVLAIWAREQSLHRAKHCLKHPQQPRDYHCDRELHEQYARRNKNDLHHVAIIGWNRDVLNRPKV